MITEFGTVWVIEFHRGGYLIWANKADADKSFERIKRGMEQANEPREAQVFTHVGNDLP